MRRPLPSGGCSVSALEAIGDDADEPFDYLDAWSQAIVAAGSYPKRVAGVTNVGGGPNFGSGSSIDTAADLHEKTA